MMLMWTTNTFKNGLSSLANVENTEQLVDMFHELFYNKPFGLGAS